MENIDIINSQLVTAYFQCPRKAYLIFKNIKGDKNEYIDILKNRANLYRDNYIDYLMEEKYRVSNYNIKKIYKNWDFLIRAKLITENLEASCDILTNKAQNKFGFKHYYEPIIFIGTYNISVINKIELAFIGYVLGFIQKKCPIFGFINGAGGKKHKIKLDSIYKKITPIVHNLNIWTSNLTIESPPVVLTNNCSYCQFRKICMKKAEREDDLSLLDRITPKLIKKYHKKGIFTVKQLSYLYKPRRKRKRTKKTTLHFNSPLKLAIFSKTIKFFKKGCWLNRK